MNDLKFEQRNVINLMPKEAGSLTKYPREDGGSVCLLQSQIVEAVQMTQSLQNVWKHGPKRPSTKLKSAFLLL